MGWISSGNDLRVFLDSASKLLWNLVRRAHDASESKFAIAGTEQRDTDSENCCSKAQITGVFRHKRGTELDIRVFPYRQNAGRYRQHLSIRPRG